MLGSIVVVDVLTSGELLHPVYDLKAAPINVQCSQIREFTLYPFELGLNATEATKNRDEGPVDQRTVTSLLGLQEPWPLGNFRLVMFQVIETNLVSSIRRVSGEFSISQSTVFSDFHDLDKCIWS